MKSVFSLYSRCVDQLPALAPVMLVLMRVFLAPIFILAGYGKLQLGNAELGLLERITADPGTVWWFGNTLGMPMPEVMAFLAGWSELLGGWLLLFGLLTRLSGLVLMFTMIIAATTAHWENGWHALPETTLTVPWEWRVDLIEEANERKEKAKSILREHGNYKWLTSAGPITVLKNGIEFSATYFLMLFVLLIYGGGRYASADYWLVRTRGSS